MTSLIKLTKKKKINYKKKFKGWCRGEKLRNGKVGWFPQSATIVIEDDHVKMANMKLKRELESYDDKQDLNRKYSLSESFA